MNIDWQSNESHVLLNPRAPIHERLIWEPMTIAHQYPAHIWLMTSGSQQTKLVALSKKALLTSAQAVNQHLQSTSLDIWINPLPTFHVGGLGIWARAYLSGAIVHPYLEKWSPHLFTEMSIKKKATLSALVPAQVYDLVLNHLRAPETLRAVIIGGGALQETLYKRARELGWPLLPSYGLTECASQVATAPLESLLEIHFPALDILSHIDIKLGDDGCFNIRSPALLTAYAIQELDQIQFIHPVVNDWFVTQDRGSLGESLYCL